MAKIICRAFDSLAHARSACALFVYVARLPPAPFCEGSSAGASDTDAYNSKMRLKLNQTAASCGGDCFGAADDVEFAEDALNVCFYRAFADE